MCVRAHIRSSRPAGGPDHERSMARQIGRATPTESDGLSRASGKRRLHEVSSTSNLESLDYEIIKSNTTNDGINNGGQAVLIMQLFSLGDSRNYRLNKSTSTSLPPEFFLKKMN